MPETPMIGPEREKRLGSPASAAACTRAHIPTADGSAAETYTHWVPSTHGRLRPARRHASSLAPTQERRNGTDESLRGRESERGRGLRRRAVAGDRGPLRAQAPRLATPRRQLLPLLAERPLADGA